MPRRNKRRQLKPATASGDDAGGDVGGPEGGCNGDGEGGEGAANCEPGGSAGGHGQRSNTRRSSGKFMSVKSPANEKVNVFIFLLFISSYPRGNIITSYQYSQKRLDKFVPCIRVHVRSATTQSR